MRTPLLAFTTVSIWTTQRWLIEFARYPTSVNRQTALTGSRALEYHRTDMVLTDATVSRKSTLEIDGAFVSAF
ncbi:hypothetical protein [Ktedonobacter sp. SOSP1-52]|uniref:hypothetical protein n=1 Tax=Ktedonobacter sp. SOSP1-52 TaxID=2778366 RepID=UPI0019154485|nr:hypothetical protein [Ktedonobacter sp. SOSP1-52]